MCSFLHVFLGFTILFTFIKDSITQYDYEKESAQRQSQSQTQLVFAQEGLDQFDQTCLEEDLENFKPASQQGLFFPYPDQQSHEFERGRSERCLLPVEMQLRTYQQEMGDNMCNLLGKVDRWHSSPHSAEESRSPRVECLHVGRLGRQCELGIKSIDQPDIYKVSAGWRWPAWPTEAFQERQRERTGEGEERSFKGIVSEQRQPSGACLTLPARGELCALDPYGHLSVWIHLGATCEPICQPDASHFEQRETGISRPSSESLSRSEYNARRKQNSSSPKQNRKQEEWESRAYTKLPSIWGRSRNTLAKLPTSEGHTDPYGWPISPNGIKLWEKQLEDYRKHQATLTELAGKARSEVTATSRIIQQLSSATAGGSQAPPPPQTEAEEAPEDQVDKEEEALRKQLQGILQNCASSLGLEFDPQKVVEIQDTEVAEDDTQRQKRPRALEPFGPPSKQ